MNNAIRNGNCTSSEIVALLSNDRSGKDPGKPFYTYIEECNMERRLKRSLCDEINAHSTLWGQLVEECVFNKLDTSYSLVSKETLVHPEILYWCGSPDVRKFVDGNCDTVGDIKCPKTLKSFCQLVDGWNKDGIDGIRDNHKDGEKYYWQLVSNACITGAKYAELIVYAPYKHELDIIRKACEGDAKYYWLFGSQDDELPYLIEGEHYNNLNIFRFEVPFLDKQRLTDRVRLAGEYLIKPKLQPA